MIFVLCDGDPGVSQGARTSVFRNTDNSVLSVEMPDELQVAHNWLIDVWNAAYAVQSPIPKAPSTFPTLMVGSALSNWRDAASSTSNYYRFYVKLQYVAATKAMRWYGRFTASRLAQGGYDGAGFVEANIVKNCSGVDFSPLGAYTVVSYGTNNRNGITVGDSIVLEARS